MTTCRLHPPYAALAPAHPQTLAHPPPLLLLLWSSLPPTTPVAPLPSSCLTGSSLKTSSPQREPSTLDLLPPPSSSLSQAQAPPKPEHWSVSTSRLRSPPSVVLQAESPHVAAPLVRTQPSWPRSAPMRCGREGPCAKRRCPADRLRSDGVGCSEVRVLLELGFGMDWL